MLKKVMRERFSKGYKAGNEFAEKLNESLERAFSLVFKGGIVMLGLAISIQAFFVSNLVGLDLQAHKDVYVMEATTGSPLEGYDCKQIQIDRSLRAQCFYAHYQFKTVQNMKTAAKHGVFWASSIGGFLIALSGAGFIWSVRRGGGS